MVDLPKHLGKYAVGEPIGRGGMGTVYLGRDELIGRAVAIKFLRPELASPEKRKRFEVEARTAARLVHPNLVTIYDLGEYREIPYIVTQYLPGRSLRELAVTGDLTDEQRLTVFMDLAHALVVCHGAGIIHRDIKPSNVRLSADDRAVLLDFGIAKLADDTNNTRVGVVVGSAPYMSPEQARGETVDGRTDLFSLGAMMYQMYAGGKPFPDLGSRREVILQRQRLRVADMPPPLAELGVPSAIDHVVRRLLAPDREKRHPSARALASELDAIRAAHSGGGAPTRTVVTALARPLAGPLGPIRGRLSSRDPTPRAWLGPSVAALAMLLVGCVVLAFASRVPGAPPLPFEPPRSTQAPAADKAWAERLASLARGSTTFAQLHAVARASADPAAHALVQPLADGERATATSTKDPVRAYAALAALSERAGAPREVQVAARKAALALAEARHRAHAPLRAAIGHLGAGRAAAARLALARIHPTDPLAASARRAAVLVERAAMLLEHAEHALPAAPERAQEALLELARLEVPEARALARAALERLRAPLARAAAARASALEELVARARAGALAVVLDGLNDLTAAGTDAFAVARLAAALAESLPAGLAAKSSDVLEYALTARRLLAAGELDAAAMHINAGYDRFASPRELATEVARHRAALEATERAAEQSYGEFLRHFTAERYATAAGILDRLRLRHGDSRQRRDAEALLASRRTGEGR